MQKLSDTSDKRIRIIHRNGKSVSAPPAPKKGIVFSLFNFSRAQTPGENTTTVLSKPVPEMLHPDTPRADLKAVKSWIALEEKVVHDYKEQKQAQPKIAVSLPKTPHPDYLRTGLIAVRNWVSLGEKVVRNYKEQKKAQSKSAVPLPKTSRPDIPRVDPVAIKNRVALEEKAVHDDKEQKQAQPKIAVPLPKTSRPDIPRADLTAIKSWVALEEKVVHDYKEQKKAQPKIAAPLPKKTHPDLLQIGLTAVRNWFSLGEKVVRNYKEQKMAQTKSTILLPKTPEKQSLPVFETFSTQTAVFSSPRIPKLEDPLRGSPEEIFLRPRKFLLVLGWLAAGVLALLYVQQTFLSREVSQKLLQLKNDKKLLEQSYVVLQNVLEDQRVEMGWLNSELQDTTSELKMARSETDALRNAVQTQKDIIKALKAQGQAFEKIIDQGGMSALSGAAEGFSREQFSTGRTSMFQGEVSSVNERRGFVTINMGTAQGAYSGRWITISRNDKGLAVGRVDRVYPTMSVAVLRNPRMLRAIQEGDSVLFS